MSFFKAFNLLNSLRSRSFAGHRADSNFERNENVHKAFIFVVVYFDYTVSFIEHLAEFGRNFHHSIFNLGFLDLVENSDEFVFTEHTILTHLLPNKFSVFMLFRFCYGEFILKEHFVLHLGAPQLSQQSVHSLNILDEPPALASTTPY